MSFWTGARYSSLMVIAVRDCDDDPVPLTRHDSFETSLQGLLAALAPLATLFLPLTRRWIALVV
jgi:hypothetical protein